MLSCHCSCIGRSLWKLPHSLLWSRWKLPWRNRPARSREGASYFARTWSCKLISVKRTPSQSEVWVETLVTCERQWILRTEGLTLDRSEPLNRSAHEDVWQGTATLTGASSEATSLCLWQQRKICAADIADVRSWRWNGRGLEGRLFWNLLGFLLLFRGRCCISEKEDDESANQHRYW